MSIHFLGPDKGNLTNTPRWKSSSVPTSFRSPWYVEGDLGFFFYKKKRLGLFFLGVQTYTRQIFVMALKNNKQESLLAAIAAMLKVG